ncbi:MAG: hypothetical protein AB8H80_11150 [Planctomycetota bacterium]
MSESIARDAQPAIQRLRYSISLGGLELCVLAALVMSWVSAMGL